MMLFRSCPRCHGDVKVTGDMYGKYKECLQCGYMADIEEPKGYRTRKFRPLQERDVA